jgi:hypothetical protein
MVTTYIVGNVEYTFDEFCDVIEDKIAELQNEDYSSVVAQQLLDLEADIVLQEYYQWQNSNNVTKE